MGADGADPRKSTDHGSRERKALSDPKARLDELEAVFAALAHAARRQILLTVWFRGNETTSSDIAQRFHCAWPTITRHLRVLEDAGLLTQVKEGRNRFYRVNKEKLAVIREWLEWFEKK